VLIALALAGCVSAPKPPTESGIDWKRLASQPVELPGHGCPYATLFVDRPAFGYFDTVLAERAASSFAQAMVHRGFELVDHRHEAYFVAKTVAQPSFNRVTAPNWIVWWVKIEAQLELRDMLALGVRSKPSVDDRMPMTLSYRKDEPTDAHEAKPEYSSTSLLVDMPETEIEQAAEYAATAIALDLLPHIQRKCSDFESRRVDKEVEVEQIREALAAEMERVRKARTRQRQDRQLELEVESEPAPPVPADRGEP
jgi:hypothetical protein